MYGDGEDEVIAAYEQRTEELQLRLGAAEGCAAAHAAATEAAQALLTAVVGARDELASQAVPPSAETHAEATEEAAARITEAAATMAQEAAKLAATFDGAVADAEQAQRELEAVPDAKRVSDLSEQLTASRGRFELRLDAWRDAAQQRVAVAAEVAEEVARAAAAAASDEEEEEVQEQDQEDEELELDQE